MPQQRMDIRMIKDILRLKYQGGLSHSAIASSLSISKGVVAKYLGLASAAGWTGRPRPIWMRPRSNVGCSGAPVRIRAWSSPTSPACTSSCAARA
jgi:hypothetical protein